jgi:hypothetical protein
VTQELRLGEPEIAAEPHGERAEDHDGGGRRRRAFHGCTPGDRARACADRSEENPGEPSAGEDDVAERGFEESIRPIGQRQIVRDEELVGARIERSAVAPRRHDECQPSLVDDRRDKARLVERRCGSKRADAGEKPQHVTTRLFGSEQMPARRTCGTDALRLPQLPLPPRWLEHTDFPGFLRRLQREFCAQA